MSDDGDVIVLRALAAVAIALFVGCAHQPPEAVPEAPWRVLVDSEWPFLDDDGPLIGLDEACTGGGDYLATVPADRVFRLGPVERTAGELAAGLRRACAIIASPASVDHRRALLQREFLLLKSIGRDGRGEVLFTGYYEPVLEARRQPVEPFTHPLYEVPADLVTVRLADFGIDAGTPSLVGRVEGQQLVPYPDRESIDFGSGGMPVAAALGFVADPVDAFFLHVQGSGTLVFPDGESLRAGYAATNGLPYRSIGRLLLDDGLVDRDEMSMQAIRAYLEAHPADLRRVLTFNPSYVFFRPLPADGGPLGCYGEPVVGGRSIATDRRILPVPVVAWISGVLPDASGGESPVARFVVNLDTGGSIVGPGRLDVFFGRGDEAGELAGRTKHLGELYVLIARR
jgi:membrane-bound lytic murein transglycosylase A